MAEIKKTMTVSLEEFGKKAGEYALDEYEYNGLTIRQWAGKITSGEYQPVRHGRWIDGYPKDYERGITAQFKCSECGRRTGISQTRTYKYCPRCGAKMDGGEKDD